MKKNILVTGAHRAGTTWVGRVLASGNELFYIHEPFNLNRNKEYNTPLKYWFEYIGENEQKQKIFSDYITYLSSGNFFCLRDRIIKGKYFKIPYYFYCELNKFRNKKKRKVVKDPIAVFSADYFAEYLNYDVLILIRHPAAFAESLKNKNWKHDFKHFIHQEEMIQKVLYPFLPEIYDSVNNEKTSNYDIIQSSILLWNLIYWRVLEYKKKYRNWIFVRHEDLSLNPISEFSKICTLLNICFNSKIKSYIIKTTKDSGVSGKKRNSRQNVTKWTKELTKEEIRRIYDGTKKISSYFYSKKDWFDTI